MEPVGVAGKNPGQIPQTGYVIFRSTAYALLPASHALLKKAARMITAPPIMARCPGRSPCIIHVHTGLKTGSISNSVDASTAGTNRSERERKTYASPT